MKDMNNSSGGDIWNHDTVPASLAWRTDWAALIRKLKELPHPPTHVVFNAGLWKHDLAVPGVKEGILEAFRETGLVSIYRTTTATTRDKNNLSTYLAKHRHDKAYCAAMDACLNMTWTIDLSPKEAYWDEVHFVAHHIRKFNEDLFDLIDELDQRTAKRGVLRG